MRKFSVIGLDEVKDDLLNGLMDIGIVQITEEKQDEQETSYTAALLEGGADTDKVAKLDQQIADVDLALETLAENSPVKKPLFFTRRAVRKMEFEQTLTKRDQIWENVREILELRDDVHKLNEARNKDDQDLASIRPWAEYSVPLEIRETDFTNIDLGILPAAADIDDLRKSFDEITEYYDFREVSRDKDFIYMVLTMLKEDSEEMRQVAKQHGFTVMQWKDLNGTVQEIEAKINDDLAELDSELKALTEKIVGRYSEKDDIECLHDQLMIERDEERIKDKLRNTNRTFRFEGWVPARTEDAVKVLLERYDCWYSVRDPEEGEDVPVLLSNSEYARPYEAIVEMYSLPDYRGVDPTKFVSIFYVLFFGMMLSDAGYGIILTLATYFILKKYDLEGTTYKMIKTFFYGGLSTIFWGAIFGGWFGNAVDVVSTTFFGRTVTIPALWFNPIENPTKLLIFSLALGIVHLFVGMGINAGMLFKEGKWKDAVFDIFSWYMVISGAILYAVLMNSNAGIAKIGGIVAIAGALILLFTGGRDKKGIGKIGGGLGALYNVTSYLSDILSYARLLALGMATGVIAQVMNTIGSMVGGGVAGAIIFVIVFVFGHTLNVVINLLGAFVHASRLQYLEFFGKFFIDGGEAFEPFHKNTKYVRLTENTLQGGNRK